MDDGSVIELRQRNGAWHIRMPEAPGKQMARFEPLYVANQLKRSILIYRAMEAQFAGLSRDQPDEKISADIASILLAPCSEDERPAAVRSLIRDLQTVTNFFGRFATQEEMRSQIVERYDLQVRADASLSIVFTHLPTRPVP